MMILLWDTNLIKICQTEASQKMKAKLELTKISSVTLNTSIAINKAIANLEYNNTLNDNTQLRISILNRQLLQQNQTSKDT